MHTACGFLQSCPPIEATANALVTSWFVIGQLFASVALNRLNALNPYDFRTPIYTQVSGDFGFFCSASASFNSHF